MTAEQDDRTLVLLARDAAIARDIRARRNALIRKAREEGHTWRAIAQALDLTETAVMNAAEKP